VGSAGEWKKRIDALMNEDHNAWQKGLRSEEANDLEKGYQQRCGARE
jgi:hypothetical protein